MLIGAQEKLKLSPGEGLVLEEKMEAWEEVRLGWNICYVCLNWAAILESQGFYVTYLEG